MANTLFKKKEVKIDTLGEYLTSVRKQLNLDIKTVSLLAQIKPGFLEDLESGNYKDLPGDVYIRGFLKSLAEFYRIKEKVLIDQYDKERGFPIEASIRVKIIKRKIVFTPKTVVIGLSVILLLAAVTYVGSQIRSVLAPPFLEVNEPNSDATIEGTSLVVAGKGEIGADIFINSQPVLADQSGQFSENLLLSPGLNIVEILAKNKFGKISKVTRNITAKTEIASEKPAEGITIIVNIGPGSAWVYLEADGVVAQRGTMLAGSSKTITAKENIIITSANAGSTQVVYNGKDLGKLGREGEVIRNVEFSAN